MLKSSHRWERRRPACIACASTLNSDLLVFKVERQRLSIFALARSLQAGTPALPTGRCSSLASLSTNEFEIGDWEKARRRASVSC
jgi:hypothetical protein